MRGLRYLMVLPVVLLLGSIAVGFSNYQETKEEMHRDLTNALRQFVMDESRQLLLLDTLHTLHKNSVLTLNNVENSFRDQLTILPLKDTSHVSVCILHNNEREAFREEAFVSSDTLLWHSAQQESSNAVIALKAYANPSFCAMLGQSDQRLSITGILFSILLFSVLLWRFRMSGTDLEIEAISTQPSKREIHLTPMQEQLMEMFASAPDHILSKDSICATLWPKKERPENTLYTFISRMKVTLRDQLGMDIINIRGKEYKLVNPSKTPDTQNDKPIVRQL